MEDVAYKVNRQKIIGKIKLLGDYLSIECLLLEMYIYTYIGIFVAL